MEFHWKHARDSILSFLAEYICYGENLAGLLYQVADDISDNENSYNFFRISIWTKTICTNSCIRKSIQRGIEQELNELNTKIMNAVLNILIIKKNNEKPTTKEQ